jgi:hypothetical protein
MKRYTRLLNLAADWILTIHRARRDAFKYGDIGGLTETDMGLRGAA